MHVLWLQNAQGMGKYHEGMADVVGDMPASFLVELLHEVSFERQVYMFLRHKKGQDKRKKSASRKLPGLGMPGAKPEVVSLQKSSRATLGRTLPKSRETEFCARDN